MLFKQFNPVLFILNVTFVSLSSVTYAASAQDNNDEFVFAGISLFGEENKDIDLSQFQKDIVAGDYLLQTQVNKKSLGKMLFKVQEDPKTGKSDLCVDQEVLKKLFIRSEVYLSLDFSNCIFIKNLDSYLQYDLNVAQQKLSLSIPDILLNIENDDEISKKDFDSGVTALFANYQYNYNFSNDAQQHEQKDSHFLNLNAGVNFAGWYLRHQGNFTVKDQQQLDYTTNSTVIYHDFIAQSARLALGQIQTQSTYLDSVSLLGAQYVTDNMMRSQSKRYFSPVIENIANSQAQIMVYQNGHKLYEKTVAAGPFKIDDIRGVSDAGDLIVDIIENDGSKRSFTVPLNMQFNLVRAGQKNFNLAAGYYRTQEALTDFQVVQASFDYGLNHSASMFVGGQYSPRYSSMILGGLWNTPIGGIQTSIEEAFIHGFKSSDLGQKYKLDYRTGFFANQKSNISASFVYQTKNYQTLSNTLSSGREDVLNEAERDLVERTSAIKQEVRLALAQRFGQSRGGTLSANIIQSQYWNDPRYYHQYQLSYSNSFKHFSFSIAMAQSENQSQATDRNFGLTLMMPLTWKNRRYTSNTQIQHQSAPASSTSVNMNVSSGGGDHSKLSYGLMASALKNEQKQKQQLGATLAYKHPKIALNSTLAWTEQQQQLGISVTGGVVAHRYGLTFGKALGDTFTIAHIQDNSLVKASKKWSENFDRWGNAIYPNLSAYEANYVQFKPTLLPLNITLDRFENRLVPKRYSSTLAVFEANRSENIILILNLSDESQIALGATLYTEKGQKLGTVGQSNQIFIDQLDRLKSNTTIYWGDEKQKHCLLGDVDLQSLDLNSSRYQMIEAVCKL